MNSVGMNSREEYERWRKLPGVQRSIDYEKERKERPSTVLVEEVRRRCLEARLGNRGDGVIVVLGEAWREVLEQDYILMGGNVGMLLARNAIRCIDGVLFIVVVESDNPSFIGVAHIGTGLM